MPLLGPGANTFIWKECLLDGLPTKGSICCCGWCCGRCCSESASESGGGGSGDSARTQVSTGGARPGGNAAGAGRAMPTPSRPISSHGLLSLATYTKRNKLERTNRVRDPTSCSASPLAARIATKRARGTRLVSRRPQMTSTGHWPSCCFALGSFTATFMLPSSHVATCTMILPSPLASRNVGTTTRRSISPFCVSAMTHLPSLTSSLRRNTSRWYKRWKRKPLKATKPMSSRAVSGSAGSSSSKLAKGTERSEGHLAAEHSSGPPPQLLEAGVAAERRWWKAAA
mmetsp:Transcript_43650/g.111124  ORF Transcript_43650/g.111124 Transcript_43650/m.111124 type:complete len:285 (+) Transcript_43650:142-996(+)